MASQTSSWRSSNFDEQQSSKAATSQGSNEASDVSKRSTSFVSDDDESLRVTSIDRFIEIVRYLVFIVLLSAFAYARDYDYVRYQWTDMLRRQFASTTDWVDVEHTIVPAFTSLNSVAQLWRFLDYFGTRGLQPDTGTDSYDGNYLLGSVLLQQKRVQSGPCPGMYGSVFSDAPSSCPSYRSVARDAFGPGSRFVWAGPFQPALNAWLPVSNREYGVGGYNTFLTLNMSTNRQLITSLKDDNWIDDLTVAVLLDFSLYNLNGNRICVARFLFQLPSYGGIDAVSTFRVIDAFPYDDVAAVVVEAVFALYFAYMLVRMLADVRRYSRAFFSSVWNIMDVANYGLILAVLCAQITHDAIAPQLIAAYRTEPYVDFQGFAEFELFIRWMRSCIMIISWLRIAKYLFTMSSGLKMIKRVFVGASRSLLAFIVFFAIVIMGYVHAFFLAFHVDMPRFRSMGDSFLTSFGSVFGSGQFSFEEVQQSNFLLGPLLAFTFFALIELLLRHMFLAIVHGSYHDHRLAVKDVNFAKLVMAEFNVGGVATVPHEPTFMERSRNMMARVVRAGRRNSNKYGA